MSCDILVTASTDCPQDCIAYPIPSPETKIACTTIPSRAAMPEGGAQGGFAGEGIPSTSTLNMPVSAAESIVATQRGQGGVVVTQTSTLIMTLGPTTSFTTRPTTSAVSSSSISKPTLSTHNPSTTSSSSAMATPMSTATALTVSKHHKSFIETAGGIATVLLIALLALALAILGAWLLRRKRQQQKSRASKTDHEAAMRRDAGDWGYTPAEDVPLTIREERDRRAVREWEQNATAGVPGDSRRTAIRRNELRAERLKAEADATGATQEVKDSFDPLKNIQGGLPGELEARAVKREQTERRWRKEAKEAKRAAKMVVSIRNGGVGGTSEQDLLAKEALETMETMQGTQIPNQEFDPNAPRGAPARPDKHARRAMILKGNAERKAEREAERAEDEAEDDEEDRRLGSGRLSLLLSDEPVYENREQWAQRHGYRGPPRKATPGGPKPERDMVTIPSNDEIMRDQTNMGWGIPERPTVKTEPLPPIQIKLGRKPPPVASNDEYQRLAKVDAMRYRQAGRQHKASKNEETRRLEGRKKGQGGFI